MDAEHTHPGRKRVSSRAMLEEAACELFLEQTYAGTTIGQITQRAGVSRNTYFNYFTAKSDVLWSGVDESVEILAEELACQPRDAPVMSGVRAALLSTAARLTPGAIPLAITQWETMGVAAELQASGLSRFLRLAGVVERYLRAAHATEPAAAPTSATAEAAAFALIAAAASAAAAWARGGIERRPLASYVAEAVTPVADGYAHLFPHRPA
jgi:AcrR family transcriptional regulator